jgi:hypothetical protein
MVRNAYITVRSDSSRSILLSNSSSLGRDLRSPEQAIWNNVPEEFPKKPKMSELTEAPEHQNSPKLFRTTWSLGDMGHISEPPWHPEQTLHLSSVSFVPEEFVGNTIIVWRGVATKHLPPSKKNPKPLSSWNNSIFITGMWIDDRLMIDVRNDVRYQSSYCGSCRSHTSTPEWQ